MPPAKGTVVKPSGGSRSRDLLKNRAYDQLRERILNGEYAPGTFLAERQIALELGMSKTPVKAALERLELEGFIAVSPQQGIIVRELSLAEIADLYEIRAALEGYTLRSISGKLTREQIERWEANLRLQADNVAEPERERGVALDAEFHLLPCEFLGNEEIRRTMRQLADKMRLVIHRVFSIHPQRMIESLEEHRELVTTVVAGDGRRAAELIENHLHRGHQLLLTPRRR
jgi:DNA-binding GntR family transcriptional regulator